MSAATPTPSSTPTWPRDRVGAHGSDISATFDAARLASQQDDVPVELVDTGAASFVVGLAAGDRLRVGLSVADPGARPIVEALRRSLEASPAHLELLEYRVGPSVGAHTGPGTAGAVHHPI